MPDPTYPAELKVHFYNIPVEGSYWVVALGPVYDGLYDWAVVSDQNSYTLFVLVRDTRRFLKLYKQQIDAKLKELGFWGIIPVYQGPDCKYGEPAVSDQSE